MNTLKPEQLRVGLLVWWTAQRYIKAWDTPGIVTSVGPKRFNVRTFDDFEEAEDLRIHDDGDESTLREMRVASLIEVRRYLEDSERELGVTIMEYRRALEDAQKELENYKKSSANLLLQVTEADATTTT